MSVKLRDRPWLYNFSFGGVMVLVAIAIPVLMIQVMFMLLAGFALVQGGIMVEASGPSSLSSKRYQLWTPFVVAGVYLFLFLHYEHPIRVLHGFVYGTNLVFFGAFWYRQKCDHA